MIGLGTAGLLGKICTQIVTSAIHSGYRLIDTAQMYENEKAVGLGIKQSGYPRDRLSLTSKLDHRCNSYQKA
jgi:diketogulonate reductase-like aldo/keto reductase